MDQLSNPACGDCVVLKPAGGDCVVLCGDVNMDWLTGEPEGSGWSRIECRRSRAYGCGARGQAVVDGLALYLRLGHHPDITSSLAIRMTDAALRSVRLELGFSASRCGDRVMHSGAMVLAAHDDLVVVVLTFAAGICELAYYLVYDSADYSLSMIKGPPENIGATTTPVAMRRSQIGGDFELILLAREWQELDLDTRDPKDVLAVFNPATLAPEDTIGSPWVIKERRVRAEPQLPFSADRVFCHQGLAFWVDLSQGLLYCDPRKACSVVDVHFIPLPPMYELAMSDDHLDYDGWDTGPICRSEWLTRTVGSYGGSVCFVSFDDSGGDDHLAKSLVRVWLLDPAEPHGGWSKWLEISFHDLWEMDGFRDLGMSVPGAWPICPSLLPDGTLSFLLPDNSQSTASESASIVDHFCGVDMYSGRFLYRKTVRDYHNSAPVILLLKCLPTTSRFRRALHSHHLPSECPF
ncbi:hypothetical protein ACP4OV_001710 [Aristida adscensionis]